MCGEVLLKEIMKTSKLVGHLNSKYKKKKDKPVEFLKRKQIVFHKQQYTLSLETTTNKKSLLAS